MASIKYKSVDVNNVTLSKPVKVSGVYTSNISYNGKPLEIQTSVIDFKGSESFEFELIKKGQLFTLFEDLYVKLSELLYNNSKDFFNGKEYSEKKIKESLQQIVTIENGTVTFHNVSLSNSVKVYNVFQELKSTPPDYPFSGTTIMCVKSLIFKGTNIIPVVKITAIREAMSKKKNDENCVLDEENEVVHEVSGNVAQEVSGNVVVPEVSEEKETGFDLILVDKNDDSVDFFESD